MGPTRGALWVGMFALSIGALVAGGSALYSKVSALDVERHARILGTLRELGRIDSELNVEVLRERAGGEGLLPRAPETRVPPPDLVPGLVELTAGVWAEYPASGARALALAAKYRETAGTKLGMIERFKVVSANLRSASRDVYTAINALNAAVHVAPMPEAQRRDLERGLAFLLADITSYALKPDLGLRKRVIENSGRLETWAAGVSGTARALADVVTAQISAVIELQDHSTDLLLQIFGLNAAASIDAWIDAQTDEYAKQLIGQQWWRVALIAYSMLLLALLGLAMWRLYSAFAHLESSHQALMQANLALKESQVQLMQAEKMSALGQMVAGIAHEINTPLAYVKGTLSVLGEQIAPLRDLITRVDRFISRTRAPTRDSAGLRADLAGIEASLKAVADHGLLDEASKLFEDGLHGIEQISEIVVNLRNFSRLDHARVVEFSVERGLDSTLTLTKSLLKEQRVVVRKEYGHVPAVTGSPSQLNQVFLNLITNAAHAMNERSGPHVLTLRTELADPSTVRIQIRDNGCGISEEAMPHIFDPFFTTKPVGQGTGMGLAISFKIIHAHGGRISVESEPGVGTAFTVLLPLRVARSTEAAATLLAA